jgi:hypothetical protein
MRAHQDQRGRVLVVVLVVACSRLPVAQSEATESPASILEASDSPTQSGPDANMAAWLSAIGTAVQAAFAGALIYFAWTTLHENRRMSSAAQQSAAATEVAARATEQAARAAERSAGIAEATLTEMKEARQAASAPNVMVYTEVHPNNYLCYYSPTHVGRDVSLGGTARRPYRPGE